MGKSGIVGAIVPLSPEIIDRIFHHRDVFAKEAQEPASQLEVGDRLFFFRQAEGPGLLEGEARIASIAFEGLEKVRGYGSTFFLTLDELDRRFGQRTAPAAGKPELLVMKLKDATKYSSPMRCSVDVPPGGLYMTRELALRIAKENQAT